MTAAPQDAEWLESDAMGGYAAGTVAGYRITAPPRALRGTLAAAPPCG